MRKSKLKMAYEKLSSMYEETLAKGEYSYETTTYDIKKYFGDRNEDFEEAIQLVIKDTERKNKKGEIDYEEYIIIGKICGYYGAKYDGIYRREFLIIGVDLFWKGLRF